MGDLKTVARRALGLLDLTDLNQECDSAAISALCKRAQTDFGPTAAVCIWPQFVAQAKQELAGAGIRIATVVNFPSGAEPLPDVREMTRKAVADGADEIDMVIPWQAFKAGRHETVAPTVAWVKDAAGPARVKAILETGELEHPDLISQAAEQAIMGGADFIKTSTGKVPVNATPEAAKCMLEVLARMPDRRTGFKPAGGVKTTGDAALYLELADRIMGPSWVSAETFRFGASGVLDDLLACLSGSGPASGTAGY